MAYFKIFKDKNYAPVTFKNELIQLKALAV